MSFSRWIVGAFLILALVLPAYAPETIIKMGTLAPKESPWHDILKDMAAKWEQTSGGKIRVKIFAGGTIGDEPDMVRKIRIGQLHSGALTTVGLGTIDASTEAFHIPMAFSSYEELDYVRNRLSPRLETALRDRGFTVLNWGDVGWVHFFVQKETARIEDVKNMKLFVWAGDPVETELWKDAGFKPVPLATTDVIQALQTGMVNAFDTTALGALSMQWFAFNKYMIDLKWAPLTGGTIISTSTWNNIPADLRTPLVEIARETGKRLTGEVRRLEKEAIDAMVKRGVKIVKPSPEEEQQWRQIAEKMYPRIRGEVVPADYFDEVLKLRDEYRKSMGTASK